MEPVLRNRNSQAHTYLLPQILPKHPQHHIKLVVWEEAVLVAGEIQRDLWRKKQHAHGPRKADLPSMRYIYRTAHAVHVPEDGDTPRQGALWGRPLLVVVVRLPEHHLLPATRPVWPVLPVAYHDFVTLKFWKLGASPGAKHGVNISRRSA